MSDKQTKNSEIDVKLLKRIKTAMEGYGMPIFEDNYPAMDILQIIKDSGYIRQERSGLRVEHEPIDCSHDTTGKYCYSCDKELPITPHLLSDKEFNESIGQYDEMYQDIANNCTIMGYMAKFQEGNMSRRRCIGDIIKELKRMKYTKLSPQGLKPLSEEIVFYHSCGNKMERTNSERFFCKECNDFFEYTPIPQTFAVPNEGLRKGKNE